MYVCGIVCVEQSEKIEVEELFLCSGGSVLVLCVTVWCLCVTVVFMCCQAPDHGPPHRLQHECPPQCQC